MKIIPRIKGAWLPVFALVLLFLALQFTAFAQDGETGEADETAEGAITEEADAGDVSEAEDEGDVLDITDIPDATELTDDTPVDLEFEPPEPEVQYDWNFIKPTDFRVVDRRNDEGGAFALMWSPSESDDTMMDIVDAETGEAAQAPAYNYMTFHSETGEDGSWEVISENATDSSYTWEAPEYFGFFLSETHKGDQTHYTFFENRYPATGVYQYSISMVMVPDPEDPENEIIDPANPESVVINAMAFDDAITDWSSVELWCNLRPLGGDKVLLEYVPPVEGSDPGIWDNAFTGTGAFQASRVNITKPYWLLFTAKVNGASKSVLEIQPTTDPLTDQVIIKGAGNEPPVADNRFEHYFRLYVVPAGYILPEGSDLPPDEWMVGAQVGPLVAKANLWNVGRTNSAIWALIICCSVMGFIIRARSGASLFLRRIAGLDHVEEAIGRATEMGRPILYTTGLGYVSDIATIASLNILGQVARKVADYETRLMVPSRDPIVMAVCQEVIQEAYIDAGRPDAYNKDDVFFLTDDQFAYTAAVNGIMVREKPATILLMGMFYAESLLLAETGASTGAIQIAGTDALAQLPFFITACDYTLIGEELYAASAYLSREPLLVGSLKGQDLAKLIFMIMTFVGTLLIFGNIDWIKQLFQAF